MRRWMLAWVLWFGCGTDEASGPVDAPVDAEACSCAPGTLCVDGACQVAAEPAAFAVADLVRIQELSLAYHRDHGSFPHQTIPATPAAPCCQAGHVYQCPVNPANWAGVWETIGFTITRPHSFQYDYDGTALHTLDAHAIGDLDCDGETMEITLHCDDTSGNPVCNLDLPAVFD